MASIACLNHGSLHTHHSVYESKVCYGIIAPPVLVQREPLITERQLSYIADLGGNTVQAARLTRKAASALIEALKVQPKKEVPVTVQPQQVSDPRVELIRGMIGAIPKGNYAVGENEEEGFLNFVCITFPKNGKFKGSMKIQTRHGDRLKTRGAYWLSSGILSIYDRRIIDALMLLIPDHIGAAMRYGRQFKRCARCNAGLTDERSRRLTIGPECEQLWPRYVEEVEARLAAATS